MPFSQPGSPGTPNSIRSPRSVGSSPRSETRSSPRPAEGRARRISCGAVSFIFRAHDPRVVSLEAISRTFSYNKAYFTTLFRKHFGVPFTDFLNRYKIENAHALIRSGNRNLSEVAQLSGFNYYAYFFRKFKEVSGMTPGEYVAYCDRLEKK